MADLSSLSLREALELVDPREAYFDVPVSLGARWVQLSAAVRGAELALAAVEQLPRTKQATARKAAEAALGAAKKAYAPHVKRVWFDPCEDYELISLTFRGNRKELCAALLERCARVPEDERLTAEEWIKATAKWPHADRTELFNTVLYLHIEPTLPDLGKDFSPIP